MAGTDDHRELSDGAHVPIRKRSDSPNATEYARMGISRAHCNVAIQFGVRDRALSVEEVGLLGILRNWRCRAGRESVSQPRNRPSTWWSPRRAFALWSTPHRQGKQRLASA